MNPVPDIDEPTPADAGPTGGPAADPLELAAAPRPSRRHQILVGVFGALAVAALAYALWRNWDTVSDYEWHLQPAWLIGGGALVILSYAWQGLTYCRSVEWLSPQHPPITVHLAIWAKSLIARYIPGNVMLVIGRAVMAREWGVPRRTTLAVTVYEQILGVGIASIAAIAYVAGYGNPGDPRLLWILVAVPLILLALHPVPFRLLSGFALRLVRRPPLETVFNERQVLVLVVRYAIGTGLLCVGVWALVRAAVGPSVGGPMEVGFGFLLAFVISFVAFILPSGIGVRDSILALVLARHLPWGVALAVSVGLRFALIITEVVFVGLATLVGRRR